MTDPLILAESIGATTRLIIHRPKALNALNRAVLLDLERAIQELPAGTRVVALTGAGDKAFVAGADIAEMAAYGPAEAREFSALGHRVLNRLSQLDAITIAEVNGFALGGGCELMMACDFAIAAEGAKIGQPEVKLGVTAGFGGTARLLRRVGLPRAIQILASGENIDASEAARIGLVNEVVPKEQLRARVDAIAQAIAGSGPAAVAATKHAVYSAAETTLHAANLHEVNVFGMCFSRNEQKEGMRAFLEKRKPDWR